MTSLGDGAIFRTLFQAYPDALLVVDASGSIVLANPTAAQLLGYTVDELVGLGVDELVPDSIRPRHAAYRAAYSQAPRSRPMGTQMELVARRRDGSEVMVEIALSPLQEHGLPYTVAAIRGIGAYPRVRQALQRARYSEQLAQFGRLAVDARDPQRLVEQAPRVVADALEIDAAVIFLLDTGGLEFHVAAGVGMLPGEGVGQRVPNLPDTPQGYVLAQGHPVTMPDYANETRFRVPPAYLEAGLTSGIAVPLVDRGRPVGVLFARSRLARPFGDEELRFLESLGNLLMTTLQRAQSEEQLSHQQRLESVGQLTGGIAHDFNNLLAVISGNLQVMEDAPALAADAMLQQMLGAASRAAKRGAELTGKLLAFSRRQLLQPGRVDVGALLNSLADMLRRTLDQRIRIEVDAARGCPPCLVDASQLGSALLNIAINARDAMPEGGALSFTCRPLTEAPPALRSELDDAAYVAIAIADTGRGMPEAVKERAFEPFFTTKEAGRGTGLGLSTVYGFAKQSRGAVTLESAEGQGTTVTLYLPRWNDESSADADGEAAAANRIPPGLRVLMVEDDAEVGAVVVRFLEALGCDVTTRDSAQQALRLLSTGQPAFDLLLTDIALGAGMRGTELAQDVRTRLPRLPVLLMTGFSSGLALTPAGEELLHKPFTRADLARAITKVLAAAR